MIVFGTDGWRGLIARDFTFENVQKVALATARYAKKLSATPTVVIGYDSRFLSGEFAAEAACVLASEGVKVFLSETISTTPQVSLATKQKNAELGVVLTASHNPAEYNGFKLKATIGGPAFPEQIQELEKELAVILAENPAITFLSKKEYIAQKKIELFDAKTPYLNHVRNIIDIEAIKAANLKVLYDPMHGAGIRTIHELLPFADEIHGEFNPSFGELDHPEPMAEFLPQLLEKMRTRRWDVGIATDGDADRVGAVDEEGNFIDSHRVFVLLMKYLYEDKKLRGAVAKTGNLTHMVNIYCERNDIPMYETAVGFKHISKLMAEETILIGGEESGGLGTMLHIPERDGIFNGLLLMEMMITRKKSLKQLVDELDEEFGPHRYRRVDLRVTPEQKEKILAACKQSPAKIAGYDVLTIDTKDGYKFITKYGWLLIRASGTEPLIRYYSEADTIERVNEFLKAGQDMTA